MEAIQNFKAVDWVRKVRDDNSKKYNTNDLKEFAQRLSDDAKKSELWIKLKNKSFLSKSEQK